MQLNLHSCWKLILGYQPYIFAFLAVASMALGIHGFYNLQYPGGRIGILEAVYSSLGLAVMSWRLDFITDVPWTINLARFLAPSLTGYAVFRGTMFLLAGAHENMRRKRMAGHVIVCGLGKRGRFLAIQRSLSGKVVAIDSDPTPEIVTACSNNGISLVEGNAADDTVLLEAGLNRASEIFIFAGSDNMNLEIIHSVNSVRLNTDEGEIQRPLECYVSVENLNLRDLIPAHEKFLEQSGNMRVTPFSDQKNVARALWTLMVRKAEQDELCLPLHPGNRKAAHIILLGFDSIGQAVASQIAHQGHFANGLTTRLTIIDECLGEPGNPEADNLFAEPLKRLRKTVDLTLLRSSSDSNVVRKTILQSASDENCLTSVVACGKEDSESLTLALRINQIVRQAEIKDVPIFVRLMDSRGLFEFLDHENQQDEILVNVFGFGLFEETFSVESIHSARINRLAMAIHAQYFKDSQQVFDREAERSWNDLPEYLKEANRASAEHLEVKIATVNQTKEKGSLELGELLGAHMESLAKMEHKRWMAEKLLQGWYYGEKTSKAHFTHGNLVEWERLPEAEREKDRAQIRAIPDLLKVVEDF